MEDPWLFAATVLTILGTPGPTNTLLATAGASRGIRRSLTLLPAEAAGYLIAILVLGLVLGPAVASSPVAGTALRLAVGAYLLFLALKLWRQGSVVIDDPAEISPVQVFVTTLLNPKALVFALGVIPFGSPQVWIYLSAFVVMLGLVGAAWLMIGAGMGGVARSGGRAGLIPRIGSAAIAAFAGLIVVTPFLR